MVRFSRVWRAVWCMGHPQGRWSVQLMTQNGGIPAQFQRDPEGQRSLTTQLGGMCNIHLSLLTHASLIPLLLRMVAHQTNAQPGTVGIAPKCIKETLARFIQERGGIAVVV